MSWADRRTTYRRLAVTAVALPLAMAPTAAARADADATPAFTIADERITESSGLATSIRYRDVVWTHNDSGDEALLYALGPDGDTRATLRLTGQEPRDWEAMASGPGPDGEPSLYVGDIGDNSRTRDHGILVHRVSEPSSLTDTAVRPTSYRLRYPDGPHDAEALLVDPDDGRLYVVTKDLLGAGVYAAPTTLRDDRPNVLERVADAPSLVTDGAFTPDGRVVLRGYDLARVFDGVGGRLLEKVGMPDQEQGESLAVTADGTAMFVGSEGLHSEVWRIPLPGAGAPNPSRTPNPSGTTAEDPPADGGGGDRRMFLVAALAAGIAGITITRMGR